MLNKAVSLIVPVFNMADYIPALWESLRASGTRDMLTELIFVNDGSSDRTTEAIADLKKISNLVRSIDLPNNEGRYIARRKGAEAASGSHIMFMDARVELAAGFGPAMAELLEKNDALMGMVSIDTSHSVYNLYWQRTHERIFWRHFRDTKKGFYLTAENYENYAKGTTLFICTKKSFLEACSRFDGRDLHSDDTLLMREIVKDTPIWVEDRLSVKWEPRQGYWAFLARLWERGPQFAEYHVFERQGLYFVLFLAWTLSVCGTLLLLVLNSSAGLALIGAELTLLALSTALFAKSPIEFIRMLPVHVGTILAYGLGAIYGVGVNLKLFGKPASTGAQK